MPSDWIAAHSSEDLAQRVAPKLFHALAAVPWANSMAVQFERLNRYRKIRRQFDGSNYAALAERFGLSSRQVRRIVNRPASLR